MEKPICRLISLNSTENDSVTRRYFPIFTAGQPLSVCYKLMPMPAPKDSFISQLPKDSICFVLKPESFVGHVVKWHFIPLPANPDPPNPPVLNILF